MALINEITSRECKAYLAAGGGLAVIPAASLERLGPHLPLGARNMVVTAIAELLADQNNGLRFPLVPYSAVYDTYEQPGSVDIGTGLMHAYFTDLCDEIVANGFERILFVSFHEELYYLCHEYFQKKNRAVAWLHPNFYYNAPDMTVAALDAHGRELWRLAGCLKATGREELLQRVLEKTKACYGKYPPVVNPAKTALDLLGNTGHSMLDGEWRYYPVSLGKSLGDGAYENPTPAVLEQAANELTGWAATMREPIADVAVYQEYLDHHPLMR